MTKKKIQLLRKLINGHNDFSFEEKIIADNILINFTASQLQIILYFLESKKKKKKKVEKDTSDDTYYDFDKIEDIKSKKGNYVLHIQGKGRSETDKQTEFVILKEPVYKAILDYLTISERSLNSKGFLFIGHGNKSKGELTTKTVQRIITKPLNKLGYKTESITSHSTRHTAISLAIEAGASLEQAQILARHKDPKTTQIYIHNRNRFSENAETKIYDLLKKGMNKSKEVGLFKE